MAVKVENIPLVADEQDLEALFENAVERSAVVSCRIIRHRDTARSQGFGFVEFKEQKMAEQVVQMSQQEKLKFHNRVLEVSSQNKKLPRMSPECIPIERGKLAIGCRIADDRFYSMWTHEGQLVVEIDSETQNLCIRLKRKVGVWTMEYKMDFHSNDISQLVAAEVNGDKGFLLEVKENPPYLYCRRVVEPQVSSGDPYVDMVEEFLGRNLQKYRADGQGAWARTEDFTPSVIGQSFAFLVISSLPAAAIFTSLRSKLYCFNPTWVILKMEKGDPYAAHQPVVPLVYPAHARVSFQVLFRINNLVQQGKLCGPTISNDSKFFSVIREGPAAAVDVALQEMLTLKSICYNPARYIKEQVDAQKKAMPVPMGKADENNVLIHRVFVTPTKIHCLGPELERSNRIVRAFVKAQKEKKKNRSDRVFSEQFLRVNFVDEDRRPLMSTALVSEVNTSRTSLFRRIMFILKEGIFIGNKHFEFLAFSSSQLREGQTWMFAETKETSADSIRAGMGDFANIRNVAKCAARMGQCFSASTQTRMVLPIQVKTIKDITIRTGSVTYCFSDGIGKISDAFARKIAADCKVPSGRVPSAFQIRYRGYKGVVARDPTASSSFKLYLRPSMLKFDSPHMSLEVVEWTKPLALHLNRQVISLLSTLGVKDSAFLNLQNKVISKYEEMVRDDAVAVELLQEFGSDSLALKMLQSGYSSNTEPLLKGLLWAFKNAQLNDLKHKARIPVASGRMLMGCLDETGILQYGQVYVKYTNMSKFGELGTETVVTQKVFVCKNPCLHPGDVRILQAVDVPELGHMVDCVVFPQRGPRPHPNECSGSDLDGDQYTVCWDESLLPPSVDPPMDYSPPPAVLLDRCVELKDIQEFFVNYMVNGNLGIITNAHVVHADKEAEKARSPKCLELAHLASLAVDFPKTGVPAVMANQLRPIEYPDFMENEHKASYVSQGILGKLYRSINPNSFGSSSGVVASEEEMKSQYDRQLIVPGFERHLEAAHSCKKLYDRRMVALMNQFGIREEAEVVSGHVFTMSQLYSRRQFESLSKVHFQFKALQDDARSWFKGEKIRLREEEEFAKASAWYYVTYHSRDHQPSSQGSRTKRTLLSFPWVVSDLLLSIKKKARRTAAESGICVQPAENSNEYLSLPPPETERSPKRLKS